MDSFIKQPSEVLTISIDFADVLGTGESISSKIVTALDNIDVDATSTVITGSAIDTTKINIVVKAGVSPIKYKITAKATTNLNNIYEQDIIMQVLEG